jgi:hypothetical protein
LTGVFERFNRSGCCHDLAQRKLRLGFCDHRRSFRGWNRRTPVKWVSHCHATIPPCQRAAHRRAVESRPDFS